ncbi:hypothetical protein FACS1894133_7360 [Clostridia bacterium]|nr:hypothetical protein FACS1894133_7360 [Clostridia bacterium]
MVNERTITPIDRIQLEFARTLEQMYEAGAKCTLTDAEIDAEVAAAKAESAPRAIIRERELRERGY